MSSTRQIMITDLVSERQVRLDVNSRQIHIDTFTITSQPDRPLHLNETQAKYQITMGNYSPNTVELNFSNSKDKIRIEFSI